MRSGRDVSVDLARGLVCVLMIQTHAFHGWVRADLHDDALFRVTRWLGSFPLPGFLLLAGVSVALWLQAVESGQSASAPSASASASASTGVRSRLSRRALSIVLVGYVVNVAWRWIDGGPLTLAALPTLLRADVLHVIGFSLLLMAALLPVDAAGHVDCARLSRRAVIAGASISVASPWLSRLTHDLSGPLRFAVAPFSDVAGVSVMPLLPLGAWCALGVVVGLWLLRSTDAADRRRRDHMLGGLGVVMLVLGSTLTTALSVHLHEPLSRMSFALWPNIVEGAGRGLCMLWCGSWLLRAPSIVRRVLTGFGTASLWIYVVHVPWCYGSWAGPLRGALTLSQAAPLVLCLIVACYGVVLLRARWIKLQRH